MGRTPAESSSNGRSAESSRKLLSPRELARALGVSESSVKRWVDQGALEAIRTTGGHRRISLADTMRFIRATGATVVDPTVIAGPRLAADVLSPANPDEAGEVLREALSRDDTEAVRGLFLSLHMASWSVAAMCDGPIRHALAEIGELWKHDASGVVIEHRAVDTIMHALSELRTMLPSERSRQASPVALGGAPAGDPYLLPSLMASMVLAEQGYAERNLGPNTPAASLMNAVEHYRPRLVWLASSADPRAARDVMRALRALGGRVASWSGDVVIGGRAVPPLGTLPHNVHHFGSMGELAAFAKGLRAVAAK